MTDLLQGVAQLELDLGRVDSLSTRSFPFSLASFLAILHPLILFAHFLQHLSSWSLSLWPSPTPVHPVHNYKINLKAYFELRIPDFHQSGFSSGTEPVGESYKETNKHIK